MATRADLEARLAGLGRELEFCRLMYQQAMQAAARYQADLAEVQLKLVLQESEVARWRARWLRHQEIEHPDLVSGVEESTVAGLRLHLISEHALGYACETGHSYDALLADHAHAHRERICPHPADSLYWDSGRLHLNYTDYLDAQRAQ